MTTFKCSGCKVERPYMSYDVAQLMMGELLDAPHDCSEVCGQIVFTRLSKERYEKDRKRLAELAAKESPETTERKKR